MKYISLFILLSISPLLAAKPNCQSAQNTEEISDPTQEELNSAETAMNQYLQKSIDRYSDDPEMVNTIKAAQLAWSEYAKKHCASVYWQYRGGTIRTVIGLSCKIHLTQERTHQLWQDYLTHMDSAKPELPEPTRPWCHG